MTGPKFNIRRLRWLEKAVYVGFPNGEVWASKAGPMTVLIQAVIEVFAPRFLHTPVVVRATLPGGTTSLRDDDPCDSLGFPRAALKEFPEVTLDRKSTRLNSSH